MRMKAIVVKVDGSVGRTPETRRCKRRPAANPPAIPICGTKKDHSKTLPQNETHHIARGSSEGHAYADLRNALVSEIGEHSIDADAGEEQRQTRKHAEEQE